MRHLKISAAIVSSLRFIASPVLMSKSTKNAYKNMNNYFAMKYKSNAYCYYLCVQLCQSVLGYARKAGLILK